MKLRFSSIIILLILGITNVLATDAESYPSLLTVFEYSDSIEEKAKQGDSNALWILGLHYMPDKYKTLYSIISFNDTDFNKNTDLEVAIEFIEKSAKKGNPIAMILMGRYEYYKTKKSKEPHKQALKWYEKAMKCGYGDASVLIYHIKEDNIDNDRHKILEYLYKGISMGSPLAARELGSINSQAPIDSKKAYKYFSLMEEWGFYSSAITDFLMNGYGCPRNYTEAIKRIEKRMKNTPKIMDAHELINTRYIYANAAKCFALGKGVKTDKDKAYYYISKLPILFQQQLYNDTTLGLSYGTNFEEWQTKIATIAKNYEYKPTIFEEDSIIKFTDDIHILKRGGVYFVTDKNGEYLTHSFDYAYIDGDSIIGELDNYKTSIDSEGKMHNPIVNQMLLDWMQKQDSNLEVKILTLDADGSYGVACILQNNLGIKTENAYKFTPSTGPYKNRKEKQLAQMANKAMENATLNMRYKKALPFYERALELNPDFELAQMNAERIKKGLANLKENRTAPLLFGISSCLQIANDFVQLRNSQNTSSYKNDVKQGNSPKKAKPKSQTAGSARNETIARNTYNDYVGQLIDMSTFRERYNDNQRKSIQRSMKQIREKWGFPKSEWEDWNGN